MLEHFFKILLNHLGSDLLVIDLVIARSDPGFYFSHLGLPGQAQRQLGP